MTSLSELRFFTTPAHDCSYLEGKQAITLFVDPLATIDTDLYSSLSAVGFRRSGSHIYRPYCQACSACIPVRVPVEQFQLRRRHRRTMKRNASLQVDKIAPQISDEIYALYAGYIRNRHADGDMFPPKPEQFSSFLVDGRPEAAFYTFRQDGELKMVAVVDEINDGLSAIYTYFDHRMEDASPGTFAILWLIERAQSLGLPYVYLGYWIKQCQKMSYKLDYKPIELYINNHWLKMSE